MEPFPRPTELPSGSMQVPSGPTEVPSGSMEVPSGPTEPCRGRRRFRRGRWWFRRGRGWFRRGRKRFRRAGIDHDGGVERREARASSCRISGGKSTGCGRKSGEGRAPPALTRIDRQGGRLLRYGAGAGSDGRPRVLAIERPGDPPATRCFPTARLPSRNPNACPFPPPFGPGRPPASARDSSESSGSRSWESSRCRSSASSRARRARRRS